MFVHKDDIRFFNATSSHILAGALLRVSDCPIRPWEPGLPLGMAPCTSPWLGTPSGVAVRGVRPYGYGRMRMDGIAECAASGRMAIGTPVGCAEGGTVGPKLLRRPLVGVTLSRAYRAGDIVLVSLRIDGKRMDDWDRMASRIEAGARQGLHKSASRAQAHIKRLVSQAYRLHLAGVQ